MSARARLGVVIVMAVTLVLSIVDPVAHAFDAGVTCGCLFSLGFAGLYK